ncbi:MAG: GWxTD domain-containing protein [Acidobacteria bacterium]|nr:GWxTD domain-containing protein [Acidobacteriota bacterium]
MFRKEFWFGVLTVILCLPSGVGAQDNITGAVNRQASKSQVQTEAPGLTDKEKKRRQESLKQELQGAFKKWLEEDVGYIITDEERKVFKTLQNDEEREQFIEQFWLRRNPDPESLDNDYKEEHYRRIAYANQHYPSGIPGWKTDRGRIYIMYGPPDEIEAHPSGGHYERPIEEGGGSTSTYPFEQWRYRYIEGVGQNIVLEFVDPTMTGEYRMTMDPSEKDALLYVPGAGLSLMEQMGLASKVDRFTRTDGTRLPKRMIDSSPGAGYESTHSTEFSRLALFANIQKPPVIKYKDLEEAVTSNIRFNMLPFQVRTDYVKVTDDTVLAAITVSLKNKELSFQEKGGVQHAAVNIFGRVTTLTRRVVQTFEDNITLDIPQSLLDQSLSKPSVYWKSLPLRSGLYRLSLALKDVNSGNVGTMELRLEVPRYEEEKLATSSLILADLIEKVPSKKIGAGQFVIGGTKVRPAVGESFTRDQKLGIYMEIYNLKPDPAGHKPAAKIQYTLLKNNQPVVELEEDVSKLPESSANQTILEKTMPLAALDPGKYTMKVTVTDTIGKRTIAPTADFVVQ